MSYIPATDGERRQMLDSMGKASMEDLFADVPKEVRFQGRLKLPEAMPEAAVFRHMQELGGKNVNLDEYTCFLGAGVYDHLIPSAVTHIIGRAEFYTAYTPYQAEISQGVLQAIYEFQSLICELTGMDAANASMYDGATALAEAASMGCGVTRKNRVLVPVTVHPEYRQVLATYGKNLGFVVEEVPHEGGKTSVEALERMVNDEVGVVILQFPNFFGILEDIDEIGEVTKKAKALFVVCVDPTCLGIMKPPEAFGADIVVGEGQSLGNPVSFGGPHLGFMAVKENLIRRMPGRIAGATVDSEGRRGFVLTLQTREQHIRRERATSNICSNQALNALAATVYLSLLGKQGLVELGGTIVAKSHYAARELGALPSFSLPFDAPFFKEFVLHCDSDVEELNKRLIEYQIIGGLPLGKYYPELSNDVLICVTEARTKAEIDRLVHVMGGLAQ